MESQVISHVHQHAPATGGVRARVEKTATGKYAWELAVEVPRREGEELDAAFDRALTALARAETVMGRVFGQPGGSEPVRPAA